jgi:hypothetical protein
MGRVLKSTSYEWEGSYVVGKALSMSFSMCKDSLDFWLLFSPIGTHQEKLKIYKIGHFKKCNALHLFEMRGLCIGKITLGNMSS